MTIDKKKLIILYRGGSKGDLLRNFLSDEVEFEINGTNKSKGNLFLRTIHKIVPFKELHQVEKEAKDSIESSNCKIMQCHFIDNFSLSFFEDLKDQCLFIFIDPSQYQVNIHIDKVLKGHDREASRTDKVLALSKGLKGIRYLRDICMLQEDYDLTYSSRIMYIKEELSKIPEIRGLKNDKVPYFEIIQYGDIFLPPFSGLKAIGSMIGKSLEIDRWQEYVASSYLPKKVDVFGETIYPANYGYVWHYEEDLT